MKKILLSSIVCLSLFANENFIEIGAGVVSTKDNFSTESKKNISAYTQAKNETSVIPFINFYYGYNLSEYEDLYITSDIGTISMGYNYNSDYGVFTLGMSASKTEEWENPFLLNSTKKETDVVEGGAYIGYAFSIDDKIESSIIYSLSKRLYDKESVLNDLKREGKRHLVSIENNFKVDIVDILFSTSYEKYNAQGKASSYDSGYLTLGAKTDILQDLSINLITNISKKRYEKTNSIFNKKANSSSYSAIAILKWDKPFDFESNYISWISGIQKEDSDINFYDKENKFSVISLGYNF